ncbi:hypothetical protein [Sediminispirochaeta bajacaliforniensis]|uniref:hypothetical protein n=1 Tax=Sediminispirochaeta bajacaliforniensis TaxID=148 RepID=UPI00036FB552|nr:hypothetical protein [Sediminispirochaeta bajacaliforniensis]
MSDVIENAEYEVMEKQPSKRGRKPKGEISKDVQGIELIAADFQKKQLNAQEADELYGNGEIYDRDSCMAKARFFMRVAQESLIEVGKQLILIKSHEEHGAWYPLLDQIGINYRTASRAMHVARRYGKSDKLTDLGYTPLSVLEDFTEDQLQDLNDGEEARGITIDDLHCRTKKELIEKIKADDEKNKRQRAAQESAIRQKEEKLNELEQKLRYREPPTKKELAEGQLEPIRRAFATEVASAVAYLERALARLKEGQEIEGIEVDQLDAWMQETWTAEVLGQLLDFYETLEDEVQNIRPLWKPGRE